MQLTAGQVVKLGLYSSETKEIKSVDALVVHIDAVKDGEPILTVAYFNPTRAGSGVLDQIDFKASVKHFSHDDFRSGRESVTWDYTDTAGSEPANEQIVRDIILTREQVLNDVASSIENGHPVIGLDGASLHDFIDALNATALTYRDRFFFELKRQEKAASAGVGNTQPTQQQRPSNVVDISVDRIPGTKVVDGELERVADPTQVPASASSDTSDATLAPATEQPSAEPSSTDGLTESDEANGGKSSPSEEAAPIAE